MFPAIKKWKNLMRSHTPLFFAVLMMLFSTASGAWCAEKPSWWQSAQEEARDHGYSLVDKAELEQLLAEKNKALIIDVRAEYEFEEGHLPGAVNIEFDLGDQQRLSEDKKNRFKQLAGPALDRTIIIYCRSFR